MTGCGRRHEPENNPRGARHRPPSARSGASACRRESLSSPRYGSSPPHSLRVSAVFFRGARSPGARGAPRTAADRAHTPAGDRESQRALTTPLPRRSIAVGCRHRGISLRIQGRFEINGGQTEIGIPKTKHRLRKKVNRQTSRIYGYPSRRSKKSLQTKMSWCYVRLSSNEGPVFTFYDTRGSIPRGRSDRSSIGVIQVRIVRIIAISQTNGTNRGFLTIYPSELNSRTAGFGMRRRSGLGVSSNRA